MWTSSFHVWLDFHHVALSRCRSLLVGTECKHVDDSKSLTRASSCVESFRCSWVFRSVATASTASSSPGRCCFLGTPLDEAPLLLAGFLIPLNRAPPVCGPPLGSRKHLSRTCSVKVLSSANRLIPSGISVFMVLACMYFSQGDHLFRCSRFYVPS